MPRFPGIPETGTAQTILAGKELGLRKKQFRQQKKQSGRELLLNIAQLGLGGAKLGTDNLQSVLRLSQQREEAEKQRQYERPFAEAHAGYYKALTQKANRGESLFGPAAEGIGEAQKIAAATYAAELERERPNLTEDQYNEGLAQVAKGQYPDVLRRVKLLSSLQQQATAEGLPGANFSESSLRQEPLEGLMPGILATIRQSQNPETAPAQVRQFLEASRAGFNRMGPRYSTTQLYEQLRRPQLTDVEAPVNPEDFRAVETLAELLGKQPTSYFTTPASQFGRSRFKQGEALGDIETAGKLEKFLDTLSAIKQGQQAQLPQGPELQELEGSLQNRERMKRILGAYGFTR